MRHTTLRSVSSPLWYPVRPDGSVDYQHPLVPDESRLPIDPSTHLPEGYAADQRDQPNGFTGDTDVMDTWATSSVTPEIAAGWLDEAPIEDGAERRIVWQARVEAVFCGSLA